VEPHLKASSNDLSAFKQANDLDASGEASEIKIYNNKSNAHISRSVRARIDASARRFPLQRRRNRTLVHH
jgi:hypothetical protein